ncbi:MAG: NADH-quinone oxidoreductase subunit M [Streptosporangiales bacterium]|nr:NADH-quinone oxidoreductase subunit M [Streptosporangiales bacterium]
MSDFPWLTAAIAVPAVGSAVVAALPQAREELAKRLTFVLTLVVLAITLVMTVTFDTGSAREGTAGALQFAEVHDWIPAFGIHYAVGVDGIAMVLILMSAILVPVVVLAAWNEAEGTPDNPAKRSVKAYFALILLLEAMMVGVFAATDVFLFYVFFEAMLIPVYFMIGSYGTGKRQYAAVKFLLYSLFGGLLMLVSVIGVYVLSARQTGEGTFLWEDLTKLTIADGTARWLFLGFFIAFAIKAPMWPFHTWLPDAAGSARPGTAVLLVGVLDKVGTYGMLRFCLELFPGAAHWFTWPVLILSLVSIVYGAVVAIGQTDMLRLIAYTSVSHFGFITLGIWAMTSQGQSGASLYMVNHGFATGALFIGAGFLIARRGSPLISDYGGVQKVAPVLAGTFLVASLAGVALPGLNSFVSEFLVLIGTYTRYPVSAIIATTGIILAAVYILWMYQRLMTGPIQPKVEGMRDLNLREKWAVAPLVALIIAFGVYPKPLLDIINPAVGRTMEQVDMKDPAPAVPAAAEQGAHE